MAGDRLPPGCFTPEIRLFQPAAGHAVVPNDKNTGFLSHTGREAVTRRSLEQSFTCNRVLMLLAEVWPDGWIGLFEIFKLIFMEGGAAAAREGAAGSLATLKVATESQRWDRGIDRYVGYFEHGRHVNACKQYREKIPKRKEDAVECVQPRGTNRHNLF